MVSRDDQDYRDYPDYRDDVPGPDGGDSPYVRRMRREERAKREERAQLSFGHGARVAGAQDRSSQLAEAMAAVADAASAYESRWTMRACERVDKELADLFAEQEADYHTALLTGTEQDIAEQAAAMVRGYVALHKRMVESGEPDDAYLIGIDPVTGFRVAIGDQRHAAARVRELHGDAVVWLAPDEVAAIVAGLEALKRAKNVFPDCELIQLRPKEPAKGDSEVAQAAE